MARKVLVESLSITCNFNMLHQYDSDEVLSLITGIGTQYLSEPSAVAGDGDAVRRRHERLIGGRRG